MDSYCYCSTLDCHGNLPPNFQVLGLRKIACVIQCPKSGCCATNLLRARKSSTHTLNRMFRKHWSNCNTSIAQVLCTNWMAEWAKSTIFFSTPSYVTCCWCLHSFSLQSFSKSPWYVVKTYTAVLGLSSFAKNFRVEDTMGFLLSISRRSR